MPRWTPVEYYMAGLRGEMHPESLWYLSKEEAYKRLKEMTGVDLGMDVEKWEVWLAEHPHVPSASDLERVAEYVNGDPKGLWKLLRRASGRDSEQKRTGKR